MNRTETRQLLVHCARLYPGRISVDDAVTATWANALAALTVDQADAALVEHQRTSPHPVTPADLWAAHRRLTGPPPSQRAELRDERMQFAPRNPIADEIAHVELARARAILTPPATTSRTR